MLNEVHPIIAKRAGEVLVCRLDRLRLGQAMKYHGLTTVPVLQDGDAPTMPYRTLAEGIAAGEVNIVETGDVPTLQVDNRGALPVLILDGEELAGGWQNRMASTSVLVPAASALQMPVSCVESGARGTQRGAFVAEEAAYPTLRHKKLEQISAAYASGGALQADQGQVWHEVEAMLTRAHATSGTRAMRAAYEQHRAYLAEAMERLPCPDRAVGVVAMVGAQGRCADIFDRAETLQAHWPRLIRSYAMEALQAKVPASSPSSARRLLLYSLGAERHVFTAPGLGLDIRLANKQVVGAALVCEGVPIHMAIFRRVHV